MVKRLGLFVISLSISFLLSSCGLSSSSDDSISLTTVQLSGELNNGVESSPLKSSLSSFDPSDYLLVIQNQYTRRAYFADIDSLGNFNIDIEVADEVSHGDVFMVGIMSKDPFEYVATIVDHEDSGVTGLKVGSEIDDITIAYDSVKNLGVLTSNAEAFEFDSDFSARLSEDDGRVVGMEHMGKGDDAENDDLDDDNKLDPDEDGIPNIVDAMDNGRDLDNTRESTRESNVAGSDVASHASMFLNYKIAYADVDTATPTDNTMVVLEVVVDDPDEVSSIKADLVHTNYQSATFDRFASGFTTIDTPPTENESWADEDYALYHATNHEGTHVWTVFIKPGNNNFDVGDFIRLKATMTDGSIEYYLLSINFKYTSTLVNSSDFSGYTGDGTISDPFCIPSTGNIDLSWTAPLDEDAVALEDLSYQYELFYYHDDMDSAHNSGPLGDSIGTDAVEVTISESTINDYNDATPSMSVLQIDVAASYPYGDNAALKYYFARPTWNSTCAD